MTAQITVGALFLRMFKKYFHLFFYVFLNSAVFFKAYGAEVQTSILVTVPYLQDISNNILNCDDSNSSSDSKSELNLSYNLSSIMNEADDPHTFSLTPDVRKKIERSDIVLFLGSEVDDWINKIKIKGQKVSIQKLLNTEFEDPHVWHSIKISIDVVKNLSNKFKSVFPENKKNIEMCTAKYLKQIQDAQNQIKKIIETLPKENKILVTNHDALNYFAQEFGFEVVTILGVSDDALPSPQDINRAIKTIKDKKPNALFLEVGESSKGISIISKETGIKIGGKLYADSFGDKNSDAQTLIKMWIKNAQTLAQGLK